MDLYDNTDISCIGPLEQMRRNRLARGLSLVDLTETNPTACGLAFPAERLIEPTTRYLRNRRYEPNPRGLVSARQCIAEHYHTRGLKITAEHVFITASTSEAYGLLAQLLYQEGKPLLCPCPTYPLFEHLFQFHRIPIENYQLAPSPRASAPDCAGRQYWSIHIDEHALTRWKGSLSAAILVSPHNPTGFVYRTAHASVSELDCPVIADEVFSDLIWSAPPLSVGAIHSDIPVFSLGGISKLCGLPDLKLSWIVLNEPALAEYGTRLEFLNDLYLNANQLTQAILPEIFSAQNEWSTLARARLKHNFDAADKLLRKWDLNLPDGGPFLNVTLQSRDDEQTALALINTGVLVHPGYFYGFPDERLVFAGYIEPAPFESAMVNIAEALSGEECPISSAR